MDLWVEERCEAARLALRIAGAATLRDAARLEAWLGSCLEVITADVPKAWIRFREDESAVVTLPYHLRGEELEEVRLHECAHFLVGSGLGAHQRAQRALGPGIDRLARQNEARDEAVIRQFTQAWHLPGPLLAEIGPRKPWLLEELVEESGRSWPEVQERLRTIGGRIVQLTGPPRWSAAVEYGLFLREEAPLTLHVVRHGARKPEFQILVTRSYEVTAFDTWADLCALTPREFGLKHAGDRVRNGRPIEISFSALAAWGGRRTRVIR